MHDDRTKVGLKQLKASFGTSGRVLEKIGEMYRKEGVKAFYSGLKFDLARILPYNTIIFFT